MKMKPRADPMDVASNVHKIKFENEKVRVLEMQFKPGDVAKMHHHPDNVVYIVKGGKLKIERDGKANIVELEAGSVAFFETQDHEATNIGNTDINVIVVELKK